MNATKICHFGYVGYNKNWVINRSSWTEFIDAKTQKTGYLLELSDINIRCQLSDHPKYGYKVLDINGKLIDIYSEFNCTLFDVVNQHVQNEVDLQVQQIFKLLPYYNAITKIFRKVGNYLTDTLMIFAFITVGMILASIIFVN